MEEYVKQHLLKHCKEEGYDQDEYGIHEMLRDCDTIYEDWVGNIAGSIQGRK